MPEDLVLEILKRMQSDLAEMKQAVARLEAGHAAMKEDISALTIGQNILV